MRIEWFLPWRRRPLEMAVLAVACLSVCSAALSAESPEAKPAGSFQIPAWTFDRGNQSGR
jgi:hypothetical protein